MDNALPLWEALPLGYESSKELSFVATANAASNESVEEDVSCAEDYYPEASIVTKEVRHITLNSHHHSTTKYHGHEDTTSDSSEASKTFYSEVEDSSPHHGGAKTYKEERESAEGDRLPDEFKSAPVYTGEVHQNITWSKHTEEYEHESCR